MNLQILTYILSMEKLLQITKKYLNYSIILVRYQ